MPMNDVIDTRGSAIYATSSAATPTTTVSSYAVDASKIYYIREQDVGVIFTGLKPNTKLYVFLDSILVSAFAAPATIDYTLTNPAVTDFYAAGVRGATVTSDSSGRAAILLHIAPNTFFAAGSRVIFVTDVNDLSLLSTATTGGFSYITAMSYDPATGLKGQGNYTYPTESTAMNYELTEELKRSKADSLAATWLSDSIKSKMHSSVINPLAQVFYVGKDGLQDASGIYLTSVEVSLIRAETATNDQGVMVDIRTVENGKPTSTIVPFSTVHKPASQINNISLDLFTFPSPVFLKAGEYYALCVTPEGGNPDYSIATCATGASSFYNIILQWSALGRSAKTQGLSSMFISTNSGTWTPIANETLGMRMKKAEYTTTTVASVVSNFGSARVVNDDYEFLLLSNTTGSMQQGEYVYQVSSNLFSNASSTVANVITINSNTRTVTLGGTNTTPGFSSLSTVSSVVVTDGTNHDILFINTISSNTSLTIKNLPTFSNTSTSMQLGPIGKAVQFDPLAYGLILNESTATSTVYFSANSKLIGVRSKANTRIAAVYDFVYNHFDPHFHYETVPGTSFTLDMVHTNRGNYANTSNKKYPMYNKSIVTGNEIVVASKTNEQLYMSGRKSINANIGFTSVSSKLSPRIDISKSGLLLHKNIVNSITPFFANTATFNKIPGIVNTGITLSTATANQTPLLTGGNSRNGLITNKHVTQTVTLAPELDSEDLVVYLTAYKPANTYLHVYGKFLSSTDPETFDSKDWTYLPQVTDATLYSDPVDLNDLKEYQYTIPTSPPSVAKSGVLTTSTASNTVTGVSTTFTTDLAVNDLIKIYSDSSKTTAQVVKVTAIANNISLTIDNVSTFTTVNGLYEKVLLPRTAFLNDQNSGLIRYYSLSGTPYDSYITFAVKIEMSSDFSYRVPRIINLRAIAASI